MKGMHLRLFLAVLVALVLSILPLPDAWAGVRPPWLLLLVLYLRFYLSASFNVAMVMMTGLCLDVLLASVLGEHAFALLLSTWIAGSKARRFGFFSPGQQIGFIGLLCLLYQLTVVLVDALSGYHYNPVSAAGGALLGLLFWPWIKALADATLPERSIRSAMS